MAMASKSGKMVLSTKGSGSRTKQKAREHSGMQREMCMMENSKMIKPTAMVSTRM